ncbi:AAA family ATPase [Salmonella enterica]|nr:AAA family ATPase [Salmonella enterica]EFR2649713.1 AAA family ATPase [Salmonella enterica]EFS1408062.1 AAA family ATPase [Salmonella enterica]EHQ8162509.1 AAA family ATPase [Salmonella enterica]EJZ9218162.1 AAA family ATPase [Salmonella enterica]
MIVVIGSNKGGPGKSTTSINVAVGLALRGKSVCYFDADKQKSGKDWHSYRVENGVKPEITLVAETGNIAASLLEMDAQHDYVIVDVAGRNSHEFVVAGSVADLIIAPHLSSQLDMNTVDELLSQHTAWLGINPEMKLYVYHSRSSNHPVVRKQERAEFLAFMSDYPELPVLKTVGFERKAFRDSIPLGLGVLELPAKKATADAKKDILALLKEVFPE